MKVTTLNSVIKLTPLTYRCSDASAVWMCGRYPKVLEEKLQWITNSQRQLFSTVLTIFRLQVFARLDVNPVNYTE